MKKYQAFQYGFLSWIVLTTCAIMAVTANHQNFADNFFCDGRYGIGYPVSFLCDYGSPGGSPIDSWGAIDLADFPYFSLGGLVVDILVYFAILFFIAWLIRFFVYRKDLQPLVHYKWMISVSIAFIIGFLFSSLIFESSRINFHNYILDIPPTTIPSPTPFETMPSEIMPIATPAP